jgi:hypothetical protein
VVLTCNDDAAADELLARWKPSPHSLLDLARRMAALEGRAPGRSP